MKTCANGHAVEESQKFCPVCGARIGEDQAPVPAAPPPLLPVFVPPTWARKRNWFVRHKIWTALIVILTMAIAGAALAAPKDSGEETTSGDIPVATASPTQAATEAPSPSPAVVAPEPDGTYTKGECDYTLGKYTARGFDARAIASTNVKNTGNIGIILEVKAFWNVTGSAPLRADREVKVDIGQRKRVNFTVSIPDDTLDALQTAAFHNNWCGVKATITGTFGSAS